VCIECFVLMIHDLPSDGVRMSFENLVLERRGPLAVITINRIKVLNALNAATLGELELVFEQVAGDAEICAVLLTGAGGRAFVAGADINELALLDEAAGKAYAERGQALFRRIETLGKPVIAVIFGFALGGGCELAMACSVRLAAEEAKLGQPEVKLGVIAGFGGTQRLPRLVGRGAALKLLLSGEIIPAGEALRIGLVDEVLASDKLMTRAEELGKLMSAAAPLAVAKTMQAVDAGLDLPLDQGLAQEAALFGQSCATEDKAEGTAAFLAKRPAVWTGK
jgi:enoyl-CoA hydratase